VSEEVRGGSMRGSGTTGDRRDDGAAHLPVLVDEVVDLLGVRPGGRYVDATLGLGGHTRAVLQASGPNGVVVGLDRDEEAAEIAKARLEDELGESAGERLIVRLARFGRLDDVLEELGWGRGEVDGLIADLGVSSYQLDRDARGFGLDSGSELDMRMDRAGITARELIEELSVDELAALLQRFGEEPMARKYSRAMKKAAGRGELRTGRDLAGVVEKAAGPARVSRARRHVATRVFMALRIAVNEELDELDALLARGPRWLKRGGRMAVISFHSLEDRAVKKAFNKLTRPQADVPAGLPLRESELPRPDFTLVTPKPILPSADEQQANPRSRSAKMRVLERRAG
jgi:16S rRNA (cytosine1402-N4)-methyltransferase